MRHRSRVLEPRDADEVLGDQRLSERGNEDVPLRRDRARTQCRNDEVARELVAGVDDMGTDRAGRKRPVARRLKRRPLMEIESDGHDLGVVALGQPRNRDRGVHAA